MQNGFRQEDLLHGRHRFLSKDIKIVLQRKLKFWVSACNYRQQNVTTVAHVCVIYPKYWWKLYISH